MRHHAITRAPGELGFMEGDFTSEFGAVTISNGTVT